MDLWLSAVRNQDKLAFVQELWFMNTIMEVQTCWIGNDHDLFQPRD
jgi:hypothetical protein